MDLSRKLDDIFRRKVLRARAMSGEEKMLEGVRLFDQRCDAMALRLQRKFPDADEAEIQAMISEHLAAKRCRRQARVPVNLIP